LKIKNKTPNKSINFKSLKCEKYKGNPIILRQKGSNKNKNSIYKKKISEFNRRKKNLEKLARRSPLLKKTNLSKVVEIILY